MTARRYYQSAAPSLVGAKVLPMSAQDEEFWRLRAQLVPAEDIQRGDEPEPAEPGQIAREAEQRAIRRRRWAAALLVAATLAGAACYATVSAGAALWVS